MACFRAIQRIARLSSLSLLGILASAPLACAAQSAAQGRVIDSADDFGVLPPRARIEPENRILQERLDTLLPKLMAEAGLDAWLVINREYAEDPVYFTLVPQPSFAARRTTMLVFLRKPDGRSIALRSTAIRSASPMNPPGPAAISTRSGRRWASCSPRAIPSASASTSRASGRWPMA